MATGELEKAIAEYIVMFGYEEATTQYSRFKSINVDIENNDNGKYSIVATDTKSKPTIAYHEFGTGFYASGKYEGELPTMTLTFDSAGKTRTTNGWQYYYPNSDTKVENNGLKGWFFGVAGNKVFSTGEMPGHQMYYSGKAMKEEISKLDLGVILNEHN